MSQRPSITRYQKFIEDLNYPEYANNHVADSNKSETAYRLNLSLWNDVLPPGVADAVLRALPKAVGMYRPAQDEELIAALAKKLGTSPENIIITAGADDALRIAVQYSIRPGTRTLIPIPSFGRYAYHAMMQQANIHYLPFGAYPYEFDLTTMYDTAHQDKTGCIIMASPNNPTGHALSPESIKLFLHTINCSVILDESLLLNIADNSSVPLIDTYPHLFICGSFSKLYGLPGLRIGFLVANRVHAQRLRKLISPFGVDALSIEIAKYMIAQDEWLRARIQEIKDSIVALRGIDNPVFRVSRTNAPVGLVEYTGESGSLYEMLDKQGVATVGSKEFPGLENANAIRVIIKSVEDMNHLKQILLGIA